VLRAAKRIPYTVELIDTILGDAGLANDKRIRWLLNHPDWRITRLATHYLTTTLPREGTLADAMASRPAEPDAPAHADLVHEEERDGDAGTIS